MSTRTLFDCPTADLLRRSLDLDDPMPDGERGSIAAHVDGCSAGCREAIAAFLRDQSLSATAPPSSPAGYELGEEIGRGGMGVVHRATQQGLERAVAVKTLRPDLAHEPGVRARFVAEAHITGRLQHPGVPPVHEVGTLPDGRPFLAMKLIQGQTLARALADRPDPAADRGRFLAVFEQVALAVGFAHAQGVIHRDLKPANVMVGDFGEVQVMDWGLARETGSTGTGRREMPADPPALSDSTIDVSPANHTRPGSVLGTPAYMPPEQARGETDAVTERADVFGLGGILCAILTGQPPFAGANGRRLAAAGHLTHAYSRLDRCGADAELVRLCKACLAADPADRPASGREVAEAAVAYRTGAEERARRAEVRVAEQKVRQRVLAWAGGVVVAVLLAGVIGTAIGLREAVRQEDRAKQETGLKETARADAVAQAGIAREEAAAKEKARAAEHSARVETDRARSAEQAARLAAEEAIDETLRTLDTTVSASAADSLRSQKALSPEQRKILDQLLPTYRKLAARGGADEKTRARTAIAATRVGRIEARLGRNEAAVAAYEQAGAEYQRLAADFPAEAEYRRGRFDIGRELGTVLSALGRATPAEEQYRMALDIGAKLAADFPDVPAYRRDQAVTRTNFGRILLSNRRLAEAEEEFRKAVEISEKLVAEFPKSPDPVNLLAASLSYLAQGYDRQNKTNEAEKSYAKALALWGKLATDFPGNDQYRSDLSMNRNQLGGLLRRIGRAKEAEGHYREALALDQKLVDGFPGVPQYRRSLAATHLNLGSVLRELGRRREAEEMYHQSLAHWNRLVLEDAAVPDYRIGLAGACCTLGIWHKTGPSPADGLPWYKKAVDALRPLFDAGSRDAALMGFLRTAYWHRAEIHDRLGKPAEAVKDWDQVLKICPKHEQAEFRVGRAYSLAQAGQEDEAMSEVAELRKLSHWKGEQFFNFARISACSAGKSSSKKQEYADTAMDVLRQAVGSGYKDVAKLKEEKLLDPLRDRDDFKKLLADLK